LRGKARNWGGQQSGQRHYPGHDDDVYQDIPVGFFFNRDIAIHLAPAFGVFVAVSAAMAVFF